MPSFSAEERLREDTVCVATIVFADGATPGVATLVPAPVDVVAAVELVPEEEPPEPPEPPLPPLPPSDGRAGPAIVTSLVAVVTLPAASVTVSVT
ncbi:MAG TPA: hypothetical protein VN804_02855, partial [Solirubrobacteraceae bacterium]|nr:hypothetical protein [Solirubrobacteraceae bacterium]